MQFFFIKTHYSQLNSHIYLFICLCIYFVVLRNKNQCFVYIRLGQYFIVELHLRKCIPKWYQNKSSNRHANEKFICKLVVLSQFCPFSSDCFLEHYHSSLSTKQNTLTEMCHFYVTSCSFNLSLF